MAMALPTPATIAALQTNRAVARLALSAKQGNGGSVLDNLREGGGYRIKFPDPERGLEAVIVNTGGGLLGGDAVSLDVVAGPDTDLMVTTQSAEKVYRAVAAPSEIAVTMTAASGARLHWLPQETILFSGARLIRRISADVTPDSELVIAEAATFGRLEMGEQLGHGALRDHWRIRRGGRLAFAEDMHLDGDLSTLLDRPAIGGNARASGVIILLAPDAESRVEKARSLMEHDGVSAGASAWDGKLVIRMLAAEPAALRAAMMTLISGLTDRTTPRFW